MKTKTGKAIAAALAIILAAGATSIPVSAETDSPAPVEVLALGDESIHGDGVTNAATITTDYFGGICTDMTNTAETTASLLDALENDSATRNAVQSADVILVSVGEYDMLNAIFYDDPYYPDAGEKETFFDVMNGGPDTEAKAEQMADFVTIELTTAVKNAGDNLKAIDKTIYALNPEADVVFQTVNNFMDIDFYEFGNYTGTDGAWVGQVSENRTKIALHFYDWVDACLNSGTTDSYMSYFISVPDGRGINQVIENLTYASCADTYGNYASAAGETGLGFYFTEIRDLDVSFSPIGQVAAASAFVTATDAFAGGDGAAISAAYDATGERDTLTSLRPRTDELIASVEVLAPTAFSLGDVDQNGDVDANDAYAILVAYASVNLGNASGLTTLQRKAADANNDGTLDVNDSFLYLSYYAQAQLGTAGDISDFLVQNGRA